MSGLVEASPASHSSPPAEAHPTATLADCAPQSLRSTGTATTLLRPTRRPHQARLAPRPAHCRPRVRRRRGHHHPRLGHRRYPHQRRGLCTQRIRCPGHPRQRRRRLETRLRPTSQAQQVIPALTASPLNRTTPLEFMTVAWMNAMGLVEHPHMPLSGRGRFPHGAGAQRSPAARRLPMTTQRMPPTASPTSTRRTTNQTMKVVFGTRKFIQAVLA